MRGDSIRDFYAKTLALLGLGVLAGTGALVDYWPSPLRALPVASPVLRTPDSGWSLPAPKPELPPLFIDRRTPELVASVRPEFVPIALPAFALTGSPSDAQLGRQVALYEPTPVLVAMARPEAIAFGAEEPILFRPSEPREEDEDDATSASVAVMALSGPVSFSDNDDRDGLIAGTSKRIGATIVKGGMKAGASVMDVAHFLDRSVRRLIPD